MTRNAKKTSKRTSGSRKRSRRPPRSRVPAPQRALVAFAELARREHLRWYVFGAQAVNLYGFPRATADVDVTVELGSREPSDLVAKLAQAGFAVRFPDPGFIEATRVIPATHVATKLPIDVVLAGPGLEQLFLEQAEIHHVAGHEIRVIAPEHLVVTKLIAGRPKDLEDVRELLAIRTLDHPVIEELLGMVEAAIGESELRARYRRLRGDDQ